MAGFAGTCSAPPRRPDGATQEVAFLLEELKTGMFCSAPKTGRGARGRSMK